MEKSWSAGSHDYVSANMNGGSGAFDIVFFWVVKVMQEDFWISLIGYFQEEYLIVFFTIFWLKSACKEDPLSLSFTPFGSFWDITSLKLTLSDLVEGQGLP